MGSSCHSHQDQQTPLTPSNNYPSLRQSKHLTNIFTFRMFWVRQPLNQTLSSISNYHSAPGRNLPFPSTLGAPSHRLHPQARSLVSKRCFIIYTNLPHSYHSFIPIVALALVFNVANVIGFTYAYVLFLMLYTCHLRLFTVLPFSQRSGCQATLGKQRRGRELGSGWYWRLDNYRRRQEERWPSVRIVVCIMSLSTGVIALYPKGFVSSQRQLSLHI
jgi:hypothetical protein